MNPCEGEVRKTIGGVDSLVEKDDGRGEDEVEGQVEQHHGGAGTWLLHWGGGCGLLHGLPLDKLQ